MMRIVLSLLFLAIAAAVFFFATQPAWNEVTALKAERQEYDNALAGARELQTLRDKMLVQYNAISQEDRDRLNKLLPSQTDSAGLITMLEDMTKSKGLLLKKVEIKEARQTDTSIILGTPPSLYKAVDLSITASGSYKSILALFSDLDKSLRLIDVKDIGFSSASTDVYEFSITAKTYFIPPVSSTVAVSGGGSSGNIRDILTMLARLKEIKIDSVFFNNNIFKSLIDFTRVLETPKEYGRVNPFMPF